MDDQESIRIQAEDLALEGFQTQNIDAADEGAVIRLRQDDPGTASVDLATLGISAGTHSIAVTFFDESDGVSTIDVQIDGVSVGSITMDQDGGGNGAQAENIRTVTLEGIDIPDGATLTLVGTADAGEQVRIDYVEVTPTGDTTPGPNLIVGTEMRDSFVGTNGDDQIEGLGETDFFMVSEGNDILDGGEGFDVFQTAPENPDIPSTLPGTSFLIDLRSGTASYTLPSGENYVDQLISIESAWGASEADTIYGDDNNNGLEGRDGNDALFAGGGDDFVYGGNGDDVIEGGEGADFLYGGPGNDIISGGLGNDYILGDVGADLILFRTGDGTDSVDAFDTREDVIDISDFELTASEVVALVQRDSFDPVVGYIDFGNGDRINFTLETEEALLTEVNFIGMAPPPPDPLRLSLTTSDDQISESESTVVTLSRTGGDLSTSLLVTLVSSSDEITFPTQVTILENQTSVSFTVSGVDDGLVDGDQLALIETSVQDGNANSANLTIEVVDINTPPPPPPPPPPPSGDPVRVQAEDMDLDVFRTQNIDAADAGAVIRIRRDETGTASADLAPLGISAGTHSIAVTFFDESDGVSTIDVQIDGVSVGSITMDQDGGGNGAQAENIRTVTLEGIEIPDGATLTLVGTADAGEQVRIDYVEITPTGGVSPPPPPPPPPGPNEILGTEVGEIIFGTQDDDIIFAFGGDDFISTRGGNDIAFGGEGNDSISSAAGDDILNGGAGYDQISTQSGADIVVFEPGNETDTVINFDPADDRIDVTAFGLTANDALSLLQQPGRNGTALFMPDGDTLIILNTAQNELTEANFIGVDAPSMPPVNGASILFGNDNEDNLTLQAPDTVLLGFAGSDTLIGTSGDDILGSTSGLNRFDGQAGNDIIFTGTGFDTIIFEQGDGADIIHSFDTGLDTVDVTGLGLTAQEALAFVQQSTGAGLSGSILEFGNGDSLFFPYISATVFTEANFIGLSTPTGPNEIFGTDGDDNLEGGSEDSIIYGLDGDDFILDGEGNDIVYGGAGRDNLSSQVGEDRLDGGPGTDRISATIQTADTVVFAPGNEVDLVINWQAGTDLIDVSEFNLTPSEALALVQPVGSGHSGLFLSNGNRLLLRDVSPEDLTVASFVGLAEPSVNAASGINQITGTNGSDFLAGTGGEWFISGGAGNDTLNGSAENDVLESISGDNVFIGGTGNDVIVLGAGADTIVFSTGDGVDEVIQFIASSDRIDVTGLGLTAAEALALATTAGTTSGTLLDFGNGDAIYLFQSSPANLTEANFIGVSPPPPPPPPSGDPVRVQAEDMDLEIFSTQNIDAADEGTVIRNRTDEPGTASVDLASVGISAGTHSISVTFFDESDGVSTIDVQIDGVTVGSITMDQDGGGNGSQAENIRTVTLEGIDIPDGATLTLVGLADAGEQVRIDYVEITPEGAASAEAKMAFDIEATAMSLPEVFDFTGLSSLSDQGPSDVFEQYRIEAAQADQTGDHVARHSEPLDFQIDPFEEAFDLQADDWGGLA